MTGGADETLGDVVRRRRLELGISQEQLAERVGDNMRQGDVSQLERGEVRLPRVDRLHRLARALNVPAGELLRLAGYYRAPDLEPMLELVASLVGPRRELVEMAAEFPDELVEQMVGMGRFLRTQQAMAGAQGARADRSA